MISIIIPIINEAATIGKLIQHLLDSSSKAHIVEIIVVDGGSKDGSQEMVNGFQSDNPRIRLIDSEKGRAKQMNAGAKVSIGTILYFLHADSFPPENFDEHIMDEVKKGNEAGCFRMHFDSSHWWLRMMSWLTQFNWRACRGGDQSQFITKEFFEEIGGFNETYSIYEDNMLINELYARNMFVVIPKIITTSDRLYCKYGVWKVQYHFCVIYLKKWLGADAAELYAYYLKHLKGCTSEEISQAIQADQVNDQ